MEKKIMAILIDKRNESAIEVQKLLTGYGCNIKVRLGLHDSDENTCSNSGLIILEMCGEDAKIGELCEKLNAFSKVKAERITLKI